MEQDLKKIYKENKSKIENPNWQLDKYGNYEPKEKFKTWIHDWEAHVPDKLKSKWKMISPETKTALFVVGEELAYEEEWD